MYPEALNNKGKEIFAKLANFPAFYLAGGTALALQLGHRISVDFDLFSEKKIPENLLDKVEKVFAGCSISVSVNNPHELTVFVDEIKITFLRYPFKILLDFVNYEGVNLFNTKEIAVAKAYAIGRRGAFKDYVDIYFVFLKKSATLDEIIQIAEKKYKNEFNSRLFLEQLVYLEDIEDTEIIFLKEKIDKKSIKKFFQTKIAEIKI